VSENRISASTKRPAVNSSGQIERAIAKKEYSSAKIFVD
jgi:hypothetical protein